MAAKGARLMMVFAVHIVGNSSPNGDKFGAWSDRNKPAARDNEFEHLSQRYTCLTAQQAFSFVKRDETPQVAHIQRNAALVKAAIAITSPISIREKRLFKMSKIG